MTAGLKFFLAAAVAVTVTQAQEAWLQPERFAATPGATLALHLTGGDGSAGAETAIKPERVARTVARLGGAELPWGAAPANERTLRYPVTVPRPGVGVLGVELTPRVLEREPAKIEAYLRAIHAGDEWRESWAAEPEPRRWRESGVTHAKTFVRVGEPAGDERTWAEPLGLALEIVPECDPTALRVGDALPVRVLRGGKPAAGFVLAYVSAGETREHVVVTDGEGRARAPVDAAGVWRVHGTDLRRVTAADWEWASDLTTMVVDVR